ncbi:hypothetical protein KUTeg_018317, partial [Tegillarca granosa]
MEEFGDFSLSYGDPELQQIVDFGTDLDEYLGNDIQVSEVTNVSEIQEMLDAFGQSAIPDLPPPETPSAPTNGKQKKFFSDWHNENYGCNMDTENIAKTELADKLSKFYAEIKPQPPKSKKMKSETESEGTSTVESEDYGKNSMKNIRGAINRHFHKDLKRGFNIIYDRMETVDKDLKEYYQNETSFWIGIYSPGYKNEFQSIETKATWESKDYNSGFIRGLNHIVQGCIRLMFGDENAYKLSNRDCFHTAGSICQV